MTTDTDQSLFVLARDALIPLANASTPIERELLTSVDNERAVAAVAAIDAKLSQPVKLELWRPVGWQKRYVCPEEGPGIWTPCSEDEATLLADGDDYQLRRVYIPPALPAIQGTSNE